MPIVLVCGKADSGKSCVGLLLAHLASSINLQSFGIISPAVFIGNECQEKSAQCFCCIQKNTDYLADFNKWNKIHWNLTALKRDDQHFNQLLEEAGQKSQSQSTQFDIPSCRYLFIEQSFEQAKCELNSSITEFMNATKQQENEAIFILDEVGMLEINGKGFVQSWNLFIFLAEFIKNSFKNQIVLFIRPHLLKLFLDKLKSYILEKDNVNTLNLNSSTVSTSPNDIKEFILEGRQIIQQIQCLKDQINLIDMEEQLKIIKQDCTIQEDKYGIIKIQESATCTHEGKQVGFIGDLNSQFVHPRMLFAQRILNKQI